VEVSLHLDEGSDVVTRKKTQDARRTFLSNTMRNAMALCVSQNRFDAILWEFELLGDFGGADGVVEIIDNRAYGHASRSSVSFHLYHGAMDKKQAIADWKSRKTPRGTYSVRFAAGGPVWVDATPDLDAARNRLLATLRIGAHTNKYLQAAWNERGEAGFRYEVLEKLDDDLSPMAWRDLLKEKKKLWMAKLKADEVMPS